MQLGDWTGREAPLDEAIVQRTDTDDHVNRTYMRSGGRKAVSLFIGYGVRMRDLMPHRPEVCYPGAGWTLDETRRIELTTDDGSILPCQIHTFYRGGLDLRRVEVLNYYIVDGRYCPDVSSLRSRAWKSQSGMTYVAQVQIAQVQIAGTARSLRGGGEELVRAFAVDSAPQIRSLLAEINYDSRK